MSKTYKPSPIYTFGIKAGDEILKLSEKIEKLYL